MMYPGRNPKHCLQTLGGTLRIYSTTCGFILGKQGDFQLHLLSLFRFITILRGTVALTTEVQRACEILISLVQLERNLITCENSFTAFVIQNLQIASPALWERLQAQGRFGAISATREEFVVARLSHQKKEKEKEKKQFDATK